MKPYKQDDINCLIYSSPLTKEPSRYEMIRYSTWRVYLFQQLEAMSTEKINEIKNGNAWIDKYPQLITNNQERSFYSDFFNDMKDKTYSEDITSHFICRMLYCQDPGNQSKFIDQEKQILSIRLHRMKGSKEKDNIQKGKFMNRLKGLLASLLHKNKDDFTVPLEDWNRFRHKIIRKDIERSHETPQQFAIVPIQFGESGLRRRFAFVRSGNVYLNIENTIELILNLYASFLRQKLERMRIEVSKLLENDVENQLNGFLKKTLETLNTTNFDESSINSQFKINIKNIDLLWKRFFPPCMLNLNQKLKQYNHLKHEGRRQLWLFLKGCGMDVTDNQAYFNKHFASKVSASELKGHMYNIQHAYGLVGKKQPERPKNCRNIITGPPPKKEEHHGCPYAHWRYEELREYLRRNYNISEVALEEVMKEKQANHFQVACGRLFEGVAKSQGKGSIPSEITNLLGKSPHEYFQAGMQLVNFNNSKAPQKSERKIAQKKQIDF